MERSKETAKHLVEITAGLNAVIALVLVASPFILGYEKGGRLTTINVTLGTLIFMFAACRALFAYDARSIAIFNVFLGLLVIATPWTMGYAFVHSFLMTHLICGGLVCVFALVGLVVSHVNRPIGDHPW